MKSFTRDVLTGATALAGIVTLVILLAVFGELREAGQQYYTFTIRLDSARGLSVVSPVTLNGVRVGSVQKIVGAEDPTQGADVLVRVKEEIRIPRGIIVRIDKGLVGDAILDLEIPPGVTMEEQITAGELIQRKAITLLDDVAGLLTEPADSLTQGIDSFRQLAQTYEQIGDRIQELVAPLTPEDVAGGSPANITTVIALVHEALRGANVWLGDERLRTDSRDLIAQASDSAQQFRAAAERWEQSAQNLDQRVDEAGSRVTAAAEELTATLQRISSATEEIRVLTASVNQGQGTLGQLARNPDLYFNLNDAAARLDAALIEAKLLIEKYRKEGVPIQF